MPQTLQELLGRRAKAKKVSIPDYGDYYLRTLTIAESIDLDKAIKDEGGESRTSLFLIAARLCDEDGNHFSEMTPELAGGLDTPVASALLTAIGDEVFTPEKQAEAAKN